MQHSDTSNATEQLLKPADAARALAVKPNTLAVWRCKGHQPSGSAPLPFVKFGTSVRYRKADVAAFIENNLQAA